MPLIDSTGNITPSGSAAVDVFGDLLNAGATVYTNQQNIKFAKQQYAQQRSDSLSDWEMQNAYNSPAAQMARLKAAGLNPNLVYGTGAATSKADAVRSSAIPNVHQDAPHFNLGSAIGAYQDAKLKAAQVDNLKASKIATDMETQLKAAQVMYTNANTRRITSEGDKLNIQLKYLDELTQTQLQAMQGQVTNLAARTRFTLDENERQAAMQQPNLEAAILNVVTKRLQNQNISVNTEKLRNDIKLIKQNTINAEYEGRAKKRIAEIWESGANPNDPAWQRILIDGLNKLWEYLMKDEKPSKNPSAPQDGLDKLGM